MVFGSPPREITVIIEVQRRFGPEKVRIWPFYVSSVWARDGCPVILLVLCDEAEVAAQYAQPIRIGRAAIVFPDVIGPDQVPVVRTPELALATALMTVGTGLGASTMTWCWRSSLSHRKRIGQCTDIDQLDAWLRRVGSVASVDELFA